MAYTTVICAGCGKDFEKLNKNLKQYRNGLQVIVEQHYCGHACRRKRTTRRCEQCGESFERLVSETVKRPSRWCSRECADIGRKRGKHVPCAACGKPFYLYPSRKAAARRRGRSGHHCSNACKGKAISAALSGRARSAEHRAKLSASKTGKPNLALRKPMIVKICWQCGGPFEARRKWSADYRESRRFCGTACWAAYINEHPTEHPGYRGGTESLYGPNWLSQAKRARERDNHTCRDCGKRQRQPALDVHHIVPRRLFNGDWRAANVLDNLISLCKPCHSAREQALTRALVSV